MRTLMMLLRACRKPHRTGGRIGRCLSCGKPIKVHFDNGNRFIGCHGKTRNH